MTDGGAVAPDRAWECFRDWVREQQAVSRSDESLTGVLNDDLFHSVMEAERPARGALYLVTIDPSFVAVKKKPVRPAPKPKAVLPRKK